VDIAIVTRHSKTLNRFLKKTKIRPDGGRGRLLLAQKFFIITNNPVFANQKAASGKVLYKYLMLMELNLTIKSPML